MKYFATVGKGLEIYLSKELENKFNAKINWIITGKVFFESNLNCIYILL